ncbi:MAG: hypothetical protein QOI81_1458 [Actinomycetota bacterium]|jgi:SAM-dependent methyltransferase|nr:hypothetical protein [Actinomycetota bacterium]
MPDRTSDAIKEALEAPVRGWDFSWLEGRAQETSPPWDFRELVRQASLDANRMLDIDTGGGEFLSTLAPFSPYVVATEGYPPNTGVAYERLAPLGCPVIRIASAPDNIDQEGVDASSTGSALPFASAAFDLIIDRNSSYWPSEAFRILRPGGRFITQQRGETGEVGRSWAELFGRPPHPHSGFTLAFAVEQLARAGFRITRAEEADTPMTFQDLAGVVYYLRLVPWAVAGFDPLADRASLEQINGRLERDGRLQIRGSHMLIEATAER